MTEINARLTEDSRILAGNPSLELLYQLRTGLQTFADGLSSSEQDLNQRATTLGNRIARLSEMNQIWQTTLQSAPQADMPPAVSERIQNMVDKIKKSQQTAQSDRAEVLTLQSDLLTEEARIQTDVAAIARSQSQALKDLLVRDGQPIWTAPNTLTSEWETQSRDTLATQWGAST
ncbi:MAG: hypothetical protein JO170_16005, partial [Verrucomicrobia bacterium]|nr:hypothetical protein [Verrucomicrobiota bacterium]